MERKLPSRRKRASKGRVIRVSNLVFETLNEIRRGKSWDSLLRKSLGLPDRQGNEQRLIEGMLEATTGKFFLRDLDVTWDRLEQDVYEIAIIEAAKRKLKRVSKPLRMRELP
jgi:hypothetical protein